MSRDHQDRLPSDDDGRYFKPFDADQPLLARCGCGKDHTVAQHQAEAAATGSLLAAGEHTARASQPALGNASQDLERFSAEFIEASMVKAYVCKAAEWVSREAMQIHGGFGYAEEYNVSRYFVDARVLSIFEGADETLCVKVIARRMLDAVK